MSKFNAKKFGISRLNEYPDTENLAGGEAHSHDAKTELVHAVLSTFLEDKFYESGDTRAERISDLVEQITFHLRDPEFVAKLAIIARKEHHMRSASHLLLASLSKMVIGSDLIMRSIIASAERPDDLTEIAAAHGLPLSKQVKRGLRNALFKFNGYQLAKYKGIGKAISMVDLFNLVHPKAQFATLEQHEAWAKLMHGELKNTDTWEARSSGSTTQEEKTENWEELVLSGKIGYMALLRNLNNLVKNNVSEETIRVAAAIISDQEQVYKSKQLPFRFLSAYDAVQGSRILADAISEAMDYALDNVPEFQGKTLIAIDCSGSMSGDPARKASLFAAALAKANKNAEVVVYSSSDYWGSRGGPEGIKSIAVSTRLPIIDAAKKIEEEHVGAGGTDTSLVFQYASKKAGYDRIIILSDNESWASNVQRAYEDYQRKTKDNPFVFAVDIAGYGTKDVEGSKVFHFTGWSERMFDFMALVEEGDSLIEYVENYEIPAFVKREARIEIDEGRTGVLEKSRPLARMPVAARPARSSRVAAAKRVPTPKARKTKVKS